MQHKNTELVVVLCVQDMVYISKVKYYYLSFFWQNNSL